MGGLLPLLISINGKNLKYGFFLSLICGMVFFIGIFLGRTAAPYQLVSISVFRAVENRVFVVLCCQHGCRGQGSSQTRPAVKKFGNSLILSCWL